jgi:hypothetical protein
LAAGNAAPVAPVTSAQVQAVRDYFTNGAAVTSVPSDGPGAAYFQNGAAALTIPTSIMPEQSFDVH